MKKELFTAGKVYFFSWIIGFIIFSIGGVLSGATFLEVMNYFLETLQTVDFIIAFHIFYIICYCLFLTFRYFIRVQRKNGFKIMMKRFSVRIITPSLFLFAIFKLIVLKNSTENYDYTWINTVENTSGNTKDLYKIDGKHRGMTVFGWNRRRNNSAIINTSDAIDDLIRCNIEWVAVVPFFYQENEQSLQIRTRSELDQWSRRDSLFIKTITELKNRNIHIMLKPHLWLGSGWRSNITQSSAENWDIWFESYRINMLHYAKMAAETDVELLCIGTELNSSLKTQPKRWKSLIQEVKAIYTGKLTYAANWDGEYEHFDFWKEMDYIGIQAYFPLTNKPNPDLDAVKNGWNTHINMLESLAKKHQKPILFTEIGYKSEASATIRPWEWGSALDALSKQKSDETQQIAYQALYEQLWDKDWFSGTYIWQWNVRTQKENVSTNLDFSPRYKPAENTITKWYSNTISDK